jgi:3-phenylpropionate/cinnamic acid dioxygenase small subunit
MSSESLLVTPEEQRALERFYFHEARLLDSRQYQQWLALVTPDIRYVVPSRTNPLVDNRLRGDEAMISVESELEGAGSDGCPIREESYVHLMLRVERAFKINAWSENPPARTRRIVGNVEAIGRDGDDWEIWSHFHLHYARPGDTPCLYAGQRRDRLRASEEGFRLAAREVVLDYADVAYPTLGLLF